MFSLVATHPNSQAAQGLILRSLAHGLDAIAKQLFVHFSTPLGFPHLSSDLSQTCCAAMFWGKNHSTAGGGTHVGEKMWIFPVLPTLVPFSLPNSPLVATSPSACHQRAFLKKQQLTYHYNVIAICRSGSLHSQTYSKHGKLTRPDKHPTNWG